MDSTLKAILDERDELRETIKYLQHRLESAESDIAAKNQQLDEFRQRLAAKSGTAWYSGGTWSNIPPGTPGGALIFPDNAQQGAVQ